METPVKRTISTSLCVDKMENPEGLINVQQNASSDAAPPLIAAPTAQPQFLQDAESRGWRQKNGPR